MPLLCDPVVVLSMSQDPGGHHKSQQLREAYANKNRPAPISDADLFFDYSQSRYNVNNLSYLWLDLQIRYRTTNGADAITVPSAPAPVIFTEYTPESRD